MPEDTRPVSQGGNRGIDDVFSRKAPVEKFRVVSVDTFDGSDGVDGDFDSLSEAVAYAKRATQGQQMCKAYIYNDKGQCVGDYGTY